MSLSNYLFWGAAWLIYHLRKYCWVPFWADYCTPPWVVHNHWIPLLFGAHQPLLFFIRDLLWETVQLSCIFFHSFLLTQIEKGTFAFWISDKDLKQNIHTLQTAYLLKLIRIYYHHPFAKTFCMLFAFLFALHYELKDITE